MVYLVKEAGPLAGSGLKKIDVADDSEISLVQMRRRRKAALRCEPLDDGRRDPQFDVSRTERLPSDYGMTPREIVDHANQLARSGWAGWELRARLADPKGVAA